MQTLKKAEAVIFQRMHAFQRGNMESQLAFITSQIAKLIFKDTFILTVYIFPLEVVQTLFQFLFTLTAHLNMVITLVLAIFMVGYVFLVVTKIECLEARTQYVVQILMPWLDIFAMLILTVSIQLLLINITDNPVLIAFNVLTIISISFVQIFYNLFNFTKEPRSSNLFKKREAPIVTFCNISTLFFCYYLAVSFFSQHFISKEKAIVYSLIQFIFSLATIKQRVFMQHYLNPFSQSISSLFYFIELNICLLVLLFYMLSLELISANLVFLLIIMTLLEHSALGAYITRRNRNMFLSSASDLKNEYEAILYLDRLCDLITKVENEQESIILISLKKKHTITCKDAECSCRTNEFRLGYFIKEYVRCELQQICEIFHNSISILISILYFKMVIFKYYPEILSKLNYYSSHLNLSLVQRYYKYCLGQYVTGFIAKKNYEISAVDSQHMFKLQEIRVEIETIMKGEIEIRSKQWKYLSRGLCRISELEHNCNVSLKNIARLMEIFDQNKTRFKKSKEFNLLLLFYFIKVSFLNNGKQIKQNLKELYFGYKEDQLYSLKEFKKFIYHKKSCVIQTLIDTKTMGIVTAATRNVEDMFGFPTNKIIGISINNLMPQFMAEEHEDIMSDWAKSGTWRTIGKLKEIYCVHKEQYCFSALIYLKIYIKDNNMHFITNIFKLNENDYLVINPNMKIEGLGRKFLKILGQPSKRMNLELLIEQNGSLLSQQTFTEGKIYRKIFLGLKNLESEVDLYLEEINMKFEESQRKEINNNFHQKLMGLCQQKYCVQFSVKRYKMGKITFFVISMKQAKKVERHQTATYLDKPQMYLQNDNSRQLIDFDVAESQDNSFQKEEDNEQLLIQHNASSSLASLNQKQNYPIAKTIEKFIGFVQSPPTISDNRLSNFNIMMLVILLLLSIINFVSYYCYKQMLIEIQGIFYADGAQSDIMQTTEISYSYTYMLKSQLLNASQTEFASTLQSARLINNYVYSLREANFASLISSVTELTQDRMFSYIEKPTTWTINKRPVTVLTHQFLENMHYITGRLYNEFERLKALNQTQMNTTFLYQLFNNFPEMKALNEFFLVDYQQISDKQHKALNYFTILSLVAYFVLSLILSFTMNNYFQFRFNQVINSFTFFSFIPSQYLEKMKEYYSLLIARIVEPDKLKNIDLHEDEVFEIDTYDLFHRNDPNKSSTSSKIKFINYQNYYKWIFIFLLFCLFNGINFLATSSVRDFFPSSETVIKEVNDLMRSENKLLENYFDLRSAYSLNPTKYINQSLYDQLIVTLNQTDTKFNSVANRLTTIFASYDPNYQDNFVNALVTNVCKLSAAYLTPFESKKCVSELTLNILDGGILISMNFFQRNVRTALESLRMQYITNNQTRYQGDYFRQLDFIELDKMLIYMFKIYQQTQAVTFNSYINVIETITASYLKLTIGMTAFFILVMIIWLKSINSQKESLAYLYGHLLLIPVMILKSNTRIASSLKEAIEYADG